MARGKFVCLSCSYKRRRITIKDGKTLVDGVDCSHMLDAELESGPISCPICGGGTEFEPYDVESITIARYSAQSGDAKRASLIKRRDDFNKSREGRAMTEKAEYYQGVGRRKGN